MTWPSWMLKLSCGPKTLQGTTDVKVAPCWKATPCDTDKWYTASRLMWHCSVFSEQLLIVLHYFITLKNCHILCSPNVKGSKRYLLSCHITLSKKNCPYSSSLFENWANETKFTDQFKRTTLYLLSVSAVHDVDHALGVGVPEVAVVRGAAVHHRLVDRVGRLQRDKSYFKDT